MQILRNAGLQLCRICGWCRVASPDRICRLRQMVPTLRPSDDHESNCHSSRGRSPKQQVPLRRGCQYNRRRRLQAQIYYGSTWLPYHAVKSCWNKRCRMEEIRTESECSIVLSDLRDQCEAPPVLSRSSDPRDFSDPSPSSKGSVSSMAGLFTVPELGVPTVAGCDPDPFPSLPNPPVLKPNWLFTLLTPR